jgi:magnesium-transporting ATPase (P-type)
LLTGELVWHIVLVSTLFLGGVYGVFTYAIDRGLSVELARTMTLNTLVVMEIFHLFFIRNIYGASLTWQAVRGTPIVWAVVLAVVLAQFAVTYLPVLQGVFATEAVSIVDGLLIVGVGVALFALLESEKQLRLAFARRAVEEA